jgi:uncharacterized protein (DUF885 family)
MKRCALLMCLAACGPVAQRVEPPAPAPAPAPQVDEPALAPWATYRDQLLDAWLARKPSWGRELGMHAYDGKLADYSPAGIAAQVAGLESARTELARYNPAAMSEDDALDLAILRNEVALELFSLTDVRRPQTDPRFYQELFGVSSYIDFDYAPLEQRARSLVEHEEAALAEIAHVLGNLDATLSRPVVEVAIKVYAGYAEYLRGDVNKLVGSVGDDAFRARFTKANEALARAADDIAKRLASDMLPRADEQSHVLGLQRYQRFIAAQEGRAIDLVAFKQMAEEDLARNKAAYEALLAKGVKATRPKARELLSAATTLMEESRAFLVERQLVTVPSDDRCTLQETPPFMRWNAAFLNMPGPFDSAKQAFYYITLPDPKWPKKEQDEYIFPWGVLQATTVHEVYPGHFLHGLWIRSAPSRVQKMVASYSFTEGWAHYTEQLMIEQGFRSDDPQNHLGQLSDALLRNCRFIASIGIHTEGMDQAEVARRFEQDCFQDKATAREQAVRGTFDPGYFAYTLGKVQILQLRSELRAELGDAFDLRTFHDALLSHGAPPIALIADRVKRTVRKPH